MVLVGRGTNQVSPRGHYDIGGVTLSKAGMMADEDEVEASDSTRRVFSTSRL